jgi:MFS family permease
MYTVEKLGQKITGALLLTQSLFSASLIMTSTVGSIVILSLVNNNSQWAGVPTTVSLIGSAIIAYPVGRLMDRYGRRAGLSVGYLLGIMGALFAGTAVLQHSLVFFLLGTLLLGCNKGTVDLGRYAAAEANVPGRRARAISLVVLGGTVGSIVGPTLIQHTTHLAGYAGLIPFSGVWFAAGILFVLSFLIINLFLRPDPQEIARYLEQGTTDQPGYVAQARSWQEVMADPRVRVAMGTLIVGQLVMVLLMAITPVHMHLAHHHIGAISMVIMAHSVGMYGLSFVTGWLVDKLGAVTIILMGGGILISACVVSPLSLEAGWLGLALFLLGLGWNFCYVAGSSLLAAGIRPAEKGRVQGTTDTLISLTSATGSLSSGLVFAAMGFLTMSWLSIVIACIPIILVLFLRMKEPALAIKGTSTD